MLIVYNDNVYFKISFFKCVIQEKSQFVFTCNNNNFNLEIYVIIISVPLPYFHFVANE